MEEASVEMAAEAGVPPPDPAPEILFRTDEIEVRRVVAGDGATQVVTFEPYHDETGFARTGFGQAFFQREGITAIHVLSAGNDWFQYPAMDEALAAVRAAVAGAERVVAYGSSMGAYAAIRFADAIGAAHVLALSPQYTIDRRRMPRERRWYKEQKRIAFRPDYNGRIACAAEVLVVSDSAHVYDVAQVAAIARDVPIREIRLPHAGHPVSTLLNEIGLLQPLARDFVRGAVDVAAFEREALALSEGSATWLIERSARLPRSKGGSALDLARQAVEIAPDNATVLYQYGMRLHEAGDYAAAVAVHREAVARFPHPGFRIALSKALFFGGEQAEALAIADEVVRTAPYVHVYVRWRGRVRADTGDHRGAARDYATVWQLKPSARAAYGLVRRHLRLAYEMLRGR